MFEKYEINNLYVCEIEDIIPMGITNFGGCLSIDYTSSHRYQTIVCLKNGKYYDISDLGKIINVIKVPQKGCPFTSKNGHLYILDEESLVSYKDKVSSEYKVLQRMPFGKTRLIK